MRAQFQAVQFSDTSSVKCMHTSGMHFGKRWQFHPELEIMFVEHSRGLRFVGSSIAPYREGDLVLIGPNLPHVWLTDGLKNPLGHARCFVLMFKKELGDTLQNLPEFSHVATLLERSRHGIHFAGPNARKAAKHIRQLCHANGPQRVMHLLTVLDLLARSRRQTLLSGENYVPQLNQAEAVKINAACSYVREHLADGIEQPVVASLVRMHPAAFSRFFRKRVGRTFSAYVNQLRVARAVHLMTEEKMNVSEACFASGFNNLSNFNCRFHAIKGMSPRSFLRRLTTELPPA